MLDVAFAVAAAFVAVDAAVVWMMNVASSRGRINDDSLWIVSDIGWNMLLLVAVAFMVSYCL